MRIGGLQKISLQDYPGKVASIVFTQGCAFRCGYCHNPELVDQKRFGKPVSEDAFFSFLISRVGKIDAVVVSGGEPLLHRDIFDFLRKIKDMGFAVKVDTSGVFPQALESIMEQRLADYIAMDIKASPCEYRRVVNMPSLRYDIIQRSIDMILHSDIDYEFRSTLIAGMHQVSDIERMAFGIRGAKRFFLQKFQKQTELLDHAYHGYDAVPDDEMRIMKTIAEKYVQYCEIR
ncbi:MAG: anaerobic ribonucleoside-triphosphate reductase activating protein [Parcubacteria group bacterium]|nr:anaerobic ribonucleoside-triphosphate reductase activating protein [Parcubacteria group bacterium]